MTRTLFAAAIAFTTLFTSVPSPARDVSAAAIKRRYKKSRSRIRSAIRGGGQKARAFRKTVHKHDWANLVGLLALGGSGLAASPEAAAMTALGWVGTRMLIDRRERQRAPAAIVESISKQAQAGKHVDRKALRWAKAALEAKRRELKESYEEDKQDFAKHRKSTVRRRSLALHARHRMRKAYREDVEARSALKAIDEALTKANEHWQADLERPLQ